MLYHQITEIKPITKNKRDNFCQVKTIMHLLNMLLMIHQSSTLHLKEGYKFRRKVSFSSSLRNSLDSKMEQLIKCKAVSIISKTTRP